MTVKRMFELSEQQAAYLDSKTESSDLNADDVVGEALLMHQAEDEFLSRWIKEQVLPVHARWKAGLEKEHSLDEVRQHLDARRAERAGKKAS